MSKMKNHRLLVALCGVVRGRLQLRADDEPSSTFRFASLQLEWRHNDQHIRQRFRLRLHLSVRVVDCNRTDGFGVWRRERSGQRREVEKPEWATLTVHMGSTKQFSV
jgi:hypothetical protein